MWENFIPVSILFITILIKFSVNRECTSVNLAAALFELPIDIVFLSTSMIATFHILSPNNQITLLSDNTDMLSEILSKSLNTLLLYLALMILIVILWRFIEKIDEKFDKNRYFYKKGRFYLLFFMNLFNYFVAIGSLVFAFKLILGGI